MRRPSIIESFNVAIEGLVHVLRTQRNMRIHFAVAVTVIILAVLVGVSRIELIALLMSIAFVLVAEMVNTAIEGAIDAATTSFDPMAKLAKDIAAGAVLIASLNAVAVGYLVFAGKAADNSARVLDRIRDAPAELTLIALVLTVFIVIATKAWTGRGTPLRGGLPSGHAALAFAGWMAATEGYRPGDIAAIGITASPCGGCRQWLYEFKIEEITFLNSAGELATYSAAQLLPDTWDLP